MNCVKNIEIDLTTYKIVLGFQNSKISLILHFDTPSRKFYLSLLVLIVYEMKQGECLCGEKRKLFVCGQI